jgi:hypothetical protein
MTTMPSLRPRTILLVAWLLTMPAMAGADTDAKPQEVSTALPPVALSRMQLDAIAAKGTPASVRPSPRAGAIKGVRLSPPAPAANVTSAERAAKIAIVARGAHTFSLPLISPSLGVIPRPQWSDPFSLKHGDITIIGGRRVVMPHPASGAPQSEAKR